MSRGKHNILWFLLQSRQNLVENPWMADFAPQAPVPTLVFARDMLAIPCLLDASAVGRDRRERP
jgi:hypothetical protein